MGLLYVAIAIVISILVIVILAIAARSKGDAPIKIPPDGKLPQLEPGNLKTGDIVAISYNGVRTWMSEIFYGSIWTHVGLIFVVPSTGEVQVIEAANYRAPYKGHLLRIPLLYWIRVNMNVRQIALMRVNKAVSPKAVDESYRKYEALDIGVQGLDISWLRFYSKKTPDTISPISLFASDERRLAPEKSKEARQASGEYRFKKTAFKYLKKVGAASSADLSEDNHDYMLTCNELVIAILQDVGVYSRKNTACSYLPVEIIRRDVETINGYAYDMPVAVSVESLASDYTRGL